MPAQKQDTIRIKPGSNFVKTDQIEEIVDRSLAYLESGFPVHFSGPTGTGKTTLALHVAAQIDRPTVLLQGDDEFGSSDLLSKQQGYSRRKVVDNFIHSVVKIEENMKQDWADSRLLTACKHGYTLIYDEFTRSRPEANNMLLSILEKRMLSLPTGRNGQSYLRVHPQFRALFTSNPEEYVGVHKTQNALVDRMVTINLSGFNEETESEIVMSHAGISQREAEMVLQVVRDFRRRCDSNREPTVRRSIMIARIMAVRGAEPYRENKLFHQICRDVLLDEPVFIEEKTETARLLEGIIAEHCRGRDDSDA